MRVGERDLDDGSIVSRRWAHLIVLASLAMLIVGMAAVHCRVMGDTKGTLLVSQEIAQHGSVRLDRYGADELQHYGYAIEQKNGHYYDFFPLGTPLLSTPFVGVANLFGFDMRESAETMQIVIASAAVAAELLLLFALARLFVGRWEATGLAALCVFGTSVASTGLTSLYSHDFAVLAATAAIYLVMRGVRDGSRIPAAAVATCLFLAYLCRPTMALLAPFLLLYLFTWRRASAVKCGAWLAGMVICFAAWSQHEFSQWLPDYYLPQRLEGSDFATALIQYLIGPSRGLFVFSPFLITSIPLAVILCRRNAANARVLLLGLAWPVAHWLTISRFPHWWGGWSFGPRLMVDCIPGLFLGLAHSLPQLVAGRRAVHALIAVLGAFSLYVNSYQVFTNPYSTRWNAEPNVDEYPEYLLDWRYPQFLHDAERHRQRLEEFERILELPADSPDSQFSGFSAPNAGIRWAGNGGASIRLPLTGIERLEGKLLLSGDMLGERMLLVRLNGNVIHRHFRAGTKLRIPMEFDPTWFVEGDNLVEFELSGSPASDKVFAFRSLSIFPKR